MKIERVLTNRRRFREYVWQIVYEWEDCLSEQLSAPFLYNILANRWFRFPWIKITGSGASMPTTKKMSFAFVMRPWSFDDNIAGKKNIIPAIIDFWLRKDSDIKAFEERYRKNPIVLISSKQVYDFLKRKQVDVNLLHWPLSLPDKYTFQPHEKKYDCVLAGRPSAVLKEWMIRYSENHPDGHSPVRKHHPGAERRHLLLRDVPHDRCDRRNLGPQGSTHGRAGRFRLPSAGDLLDHNRASASSGRFGNAGFVRNVARAKRGLRRCQHVCLPAVAVVGCVHLPSHPQSYARKRQVNA